MQESKEGINQNDRVAERGPTKAATGTGPLPTPDFGKRKAGSMNSGIAIVPAECDQTSEGSIKSLVNEKGNNIAEPITTPTPPLAKQASSPTSQTQDSITPPIALSSPSELTKSMPKPLSSTSLRHHPHSLHQSYRPPTQTRVLNNLLPIVGFLELTNALDFPANVWNTIPVPLFVVGLMATGGSISIIVSFVAFYDFLLSYRNFQLLRKERSHLLSLKAKLDIEKEPGQRAIMLQAWLDLNFRQLGWEFIDRMLMDALNGFAGILVGVGTLLGIGGADPRVFRASNLLSGYVGNSFNVLYAVVSTAWSVYMWKRSRMFHRAVRAGVQEQVLRRRMLGRLKRHSAYAIFQGASALVAAIGSIISATMWQGYIVLVPCVVAAVITNLLWRKGIGYNRELFMLRRDALEMDVEAKLLFAIRAQETIRNQESHALVEGLDGREVVDFMVDHEMFEDFSMRLLHDLGPRRVDLGIKEDQEEVVINQSMLGKLEEKDLLNSARHCLAKTGFHCFRDQERMLVELLGCCLSQGGSRHVSDTKEAKSIEKVV